MKKYFIIILILIVHLSAFSQSTKRLYKNGIKNYDEGKYYLALNLFSKAIKIDSTFVDAYLYRAKVYKKINKLQLAAEDYEMTTIISPNVVDYFLETSKMYYKIKNYEKALYYSSETLILDDNNFQAYQIESLAYIKIKIYKDAIVAANNALKINETFEEYYIKGVAYDSLKNYKQAIINYKKAIDLNKNFKKVYISLTKTYLKNKDYNNSLITINSIINRFPNYPEAYNTRSLVYYKMNKIPSAINDLSKLETLIDDPNILLKRGKYYFQSNLFLNAKSDFTQLIAISDSNNEAIYWRGRANEELLEINAAIKDYKNYIVVTQNSVNNTYIKDAKKRLYILNKEDNSPVLTIYSPIIKNNSIQIPFNSDSIYIKGIIKDENEIKFFTINGENITINKDNSFTYLLDKSNTNNVKIEIADIYNNTTKKNYLINREELVISKNNPMGKTWVVFIENSEYNTFMDIKGPAKDVVLIKKALSNYEIHNFIHKKNMTKQDMERFLSIELRDLIKNKNVTSLLIWYAGHGKFINETGYWIPSDGNSNDEFTYFNINTLKASILSYMSNLKHILIISDACETGESFYTAMRSSNEDKLCDDKKATEFKSAQVVSSAGYELASDNSLFTKIFAKSLIYNNNVCISIESIVKNITKSTISQKQKTIFGKISGVEDENGTFFFVRKSLNNIK